MASRRATLEYLTTTKIGERGQLTVPKQFRKDLGLGMGAPFAVLRLGDGLVLLPEQQRFEHLCEQVGSARSRGLALRQQQFWPRCLKRESASLRAITRSQIPPGRPHVASLAANARSDEPTANSAVPRLECPHRGHCFPVGPRQGGVVCVRCAALQTGASTGCSR